MKKYKQMMGTAVVLLCTVVWLPVQVMAADALYRMLHTEEVESFRKDQDALVVAQLTAYGKQGFEISVSKVLSGKIDKNALWVRDGFKYGWTLGEEHLPQVGDACVLSLKREKDMYVVAWGAFKADSTDYRTLQLLTPETRYSSCEADVAAIQWYVNSGGKENNFYFENTRAYVRRPDGSSVMIYPVEDIEKPASSVSVTVKEEAAAPQTVYIVKGQKNLWAGLTQHVIIGTGFICLLSMSAVWIFWWRGQGRKSTYRMK